MQLYTTSINTTCYLYLYLLLVIVLATFTNATYLAVFYCCPGVANHNKCDKNDRPKSNEVSKIKLFPNSGSH